MSTDRQQERQPDPRSDGQPDFNLRDERIEAALPALNDCVVLSVGGDISSNEAFHRAVTTAMMPHSREFIDELVAAVRNQQPISPDLLGREERLVRSAVEAAGDEHGTSGFTTRVAWLSQRTSFLSCQPESDPTGRSETSVSLSSFELSDPRAYRDAKVTVRPNHLTSALGRDLLIGKDPSFLFEFEPSGLSRWENMQGLLGELSTHMPRADWAEFKNVQQVTWESKLQGCAIATTHDGIEVVLKG